MPTLFKTVIYIILMTFLIVLIGSILLEQFPQLQPLWEEFTVIVKEVYQSSKMKYGTIATVAIIVGVFIMIGTSRVR